MAPSTEKIPGRRDPILRALGYTARHLREGASWRTAIDGILQRLGDAAAASRTYVFENDTRQDGALETSQRYEWTAPGVTPELDNPELQGFCYGREGFGRWPPLLAAATPVEGPVAELPAAERAVLEAQQILSILIVPIFVGRSWWGFIGFDDCVAARRWTVSEIEALTAAANILGAAIQQERLESLERKLAHLARHDDLTDLPNRRALRDALEKVHARAARAGKIYSLAALDLDGFKQINDRHGHAVGDRVLADLAGIFRGMVRRGDWIGRWGGEEFLALLPETGGETAWRIMERLRGAVAGAAIAASDDATVGLTVSIGVASFPADGDQPETLLSAADRALYQAKGEGRDRVVAASTPAPAPGP